MRILILVFLVFSLVFAERPRALSPKQHIAYVCAHNTRDMVSCCYDDHPKNTVPSKGVSRILGEWSASYDTLPVAKLADIMKGIQEKHQAPEFDREIPTDRREFLKNYVEAQMVAYESADVGVSSGWFYWTLKMEGGAFAEWDFLRGIREGWIPKIPAPGVDSQELYGSCHDIADRTKDDMSIIHEFPDPSTLPANNWQGVEIDDDYVVSHANTVQVPGSKGQKGTVTTGETGNNKKSENGATTHQSGLKSDSGKTSTEEEKKGKGGFFPIVVICFFCWGIWHVFFKHEEVRLRSQYTPIDTPTSLSV